MGRQIFINQMQCNFNLRQPKACLLYTSLFRTALKADNGEEATTKTNLLKQTKLIKCSGETNEKEVARYAVDGDVKTKWCDTSTAPNYIDFDFGKEQTLSLIHISTSLPSLPCAKLPKF